MGGAVSTGEDNDDLVDNLVEHACITSSHVEHVFRAVDRAHYFTEDSRDSAYKDTAWRSDNLHLSAPCIYSSVMENLSLKPGHSFLNIGSGTGYVSTMAGLIIESRGINHGVELFQDVIDYAHERLAEFMSHSTAVDQFDFCRPQFVCGNGLLIGMGRQYDRVYCGARCPISELPYLKQLLKIGGVLVVPVNDHLKRIERLGDDQWDVQDKLSVSFAGLIEPRVSGHKAELTMPPLVPDSLQQLCRTRIRCILRARLLAARPELGAAPCRQQSARRRRRPPGRRAEQARRIQRFVIPLFDAAVAEADGASDGDEAADEDERRQLDELGQLGQIVYGAVARMAGAETAATRSDHSADHSEDEDDGEDEEDEEQDREDHTDHSEEAYMELAAAAEHGPAEEIRSEDEEARPAAEGEAAAAPPDRASLKRSSEESGGGEPAAGAGPSETQKRGRRDKFDSGLGDSPPPPPPAALPRRDHSEPENGVAASSDDDDEAAEEGHGRRPLMLLPPPSRWGGRPARLRPGIATELNRFLAAESDDELDALEEPRDENMPPRAECVFGMGRRRRRGRRPRRPNTATGRFLAEQLRARIAALPLPPPLRQYVNLGRPL